MQAFTHFSRHAFKRLCQRTQLNVEDVLHLLDSGAYVNTGCKPGFDKEHLAFFSLADDQTFVAIRDRMAGTVITILPLDYHDNLAWPISAEIQDEARRRATGCAAPSPVKSGASKIHVSAHYLDEQGARKTKVLKKFDSLDFGNSLARFIDEVPVSCLPDLAAAKGVDTKRISFLSVRWGSKGVPVVIDCDGVLPANAAC